MTYLNVDEIESAIQNLASTYPAISSLITLPHLTHDGRQTRALKVGTKPAAAVDAVLVLGGVHAREWVPPDALVSLAADLLEAYDLGTGLGYGGKSFTATEINSLLNVVNLFLYPCVNPDGRFHSQNVDFNWRKNRRPASGGGGSSCHGVDLNRNFDFVWDHKNKFAGNSGVRTSDDPCNYQVYRGPSASSEPETQNVVWLLDTYTRIRWHVDVHSAIPVVLHNWGSDENQTGHPVQNFLNSAFDSVRGRKGDSEYGEYVSATDLNVFNSLGTAMNDAILAVRSVNYGVEQAYGLYPTSGASDDYAFSRHIADPLKTKAYGYTVECGSSFQPSWSEAENVIREVSAGLIAFSMNAPCLTDPLNVNLTTTSVVFNDIPEGETTARAIRFDVTGCDALTFQIVSSPSNSQFTTLLGTSVSLAAAPIALPRTARIWLTYTGTTAGATATGTVQVRCVETGEVWDVSLSANTIARPKTAVVMVLDQSGSMDWDAGDGRKRVEVLREAGQIFATVLQPDTGIGVTRFDHDAYLGMAIQEAGPEIFGAGRAAFLAAVNSHTPNPLGATSIGDGAEMAANMLDAVTGYEATAMIVLTDGQQNAPKSISNVAASIDDTVFAVGLGAPEVINPTALTELTDGSGGYVVMTGVLSSDEYFVLSKYYLQILAGVTNDQIVLDPSGYLKPGGTQSIPFDLNEADSGADVILLSPAPNAIRFVLETANGDIVTPGSLPAMVRYIEGQGVAYYRFSLPVVDHAGKAHAGRWLAHLECDEDGFYRYLNSIEDDPKAYEHASVHGLRFALEVHARSSLRMNAALHQKENEPGAPMYLAARLAEYGIPVEGRARVHAEVSGPGGYNEDIRLKETRPGSFSAEFQSGDYGVYCFRIVAGGKTLRGNRFTREKSLTGSIYIPKPPEDPPPPDDDDDGDDNCRKVLQILFMVIEEDDELRERLGWLLEEHGVRLEEVMECLYLAGYTRGAALPRLTHGRGRIIGSR